MSILHAFILGVVEGITEFLPISSTGHLILVSDWLGIAQTNAVKSFEIIIQLGAILAVVVIYSKKIFTNLELVKKVIVGFIPTMFLGAILYKIVKTVLLGNVHVVAWSLIIGGVAIILIEQIHKQHPRFAVPKNEMTFKTAALTGVFQSLAMIPGVSRSGASIMGGLLMGISRTTIAEFSFLLAVPTMAAASALDIYKSWADFSVGDLQVLTVGFITSFIVAIFSIRWLLKFVKTRTFTGFGLYRIIVGVVFLLTL